MAVTPVDAAGKLVNSLHAMGMAYERRMLVANLPDYRCSRGVILTPFYRVGAGHHISRLKRIQYVAHGL